LETTPAAYGAVTLSTLVESVAAAFLPEIPESASALFLILLLFTLVRYGLIGAMAGYLRAGRQRGNLWLATGGGVIMGIILFFAANLFLKLPVNAGQLIFVLVESFALALASSLIVGWAPRFPFRQTMPIGALLYLGILAPVALGNDFRIGVVTEAYFLAIMASSWALLAGLGGQFSFAHMALMAVGAYSPGCWGATWAFPLCRGSSPVR
jgi:hypothetical protein